MFRPVRVLLAPALMFIALSSAVSANTPIIQYVVTPEHAGQTITVSAQFDLQQVRVGQSVYVMDFNQLAGAELWVGGERKSLSLERKGDNTFIRGLPSRGKARLIYSLECVTRPEINYRKRLMGGPGYVMARLGLFAAIAGRESEPVSVSWMLPDGWSLALGREGMQKWRDTQETIWLAGRFSQQRLQAGPGATFNMAVLEGTGPQGGERCVNAATAVFGHAWKAYGALSGPQFGLAVFPKGTVGGGTALGTTLVTENDPVIAVHELLHWWSNPDTPAWFREGVHTYMAAALLRHLGMMDEAEFQGYLRTRLAQHQSVIRSEGLKSLAASSADYDAGKGGGDMYGLMPVFAYRLDLEIQEATGNNLAEVFARVLRERETRFDLNELILEVTGYDPCPLFSRYFDQVVTDPESLYLGLDPGP